MQNIRSDVHLTGFNNGVRTTPEFYQKCELLETLITLVEKELDFFLSTSGRNLVWTIQPDKEALIRASVALSEPLVMPSGRIATIGVCHYSQTVVSDTGFIEYEGGGQPLTINEVCVRIVNFLWEK